MCWFESLTRNSRRPTSANGATAAREGGGRTVNVFVKRVKAATVERRGLEDLEEELVELVI